MLSNYRLKAKPILEKVARPISFVHPNIITVIGLLPSIGFVCALSKRNYLLALGMVLLSTFDALDGTVARMTGKESKFGGVLDSTLDRASDLFYIVGFAYANIISWELALIVLLPTFLISYIRSRTELAARGKIKLDIGIIERSERILIIAGGVLMAWAMPNLINSYFIIFSVLSFSTVIQRLWMSYKVLK